MRYALRTAALALALSFTALSGTAAMAKEELIGQTSFGLKPIRDVIEVGGREGAFVGLRMEVQQSAVEIVDLKVVYGNGSSEDISVRQVFKAGSSSRVIDLKGFKRAIKQIIVTYVPQGPAKIRFFGVQAAGGGGADWERLGCKEVRFLVDKDTVTVGRREGTFKAIRLKVRKAPVEMFALRVVYANGAKQDIQVRAVIPDGATTRNIDLAGNNRGIDKIEMIYRAIPTFKGTAEVCVDGLQR